MAITKIFQTICSECGTLLDEEEIGEEVCSCCKGEYTAMQEEFYYCDKCESLLYDTVCQYCKS